MDVNKFLKKIVGRKITKALAGYGSFVVLDFEFQEAEERLYDWKLWIQHSSWRIETDLHLILASEFKDRALFKNIIEQFIGSVVEEAEAYGVCNDLLIRFSNGFILRTFSYLMSDEDHVFSSWELFMADNNVIGVGPGEKVTYSSAGEP